jgi:NADH:ubiquinone oxidoreductase subunit 3 (subunit A)
MSINCNCDALNSTQARTGTGGDESEPGGGSSHDTIKVRLSIHKDLEPASYSTVQSSPVQSSKVVNGQRNMNMQKLILHFSSCYLLFTLLFCLFDLTLIIHSWLWPQQTVTSPRIMLFNVVRIFS